MSDNERALEIRHIEEVLSELNDRFNTATSWSEKGVLVDYILGYELRWQALAA
jgi:hypothetical protein